MPRTVQNKRTLDIQRTKSKEYDDENLEKQKKRNYEILEKIPDLRFQRGSTNLVRRNCAVYRLYRYCDEPITRIAENIGRNNSFVQKIVGEMFEFFAQNEPNGETVLEEELGMPQKFSADSNSRKQGILTWAELANKVLEEENNALTADELSTRILSLGLLSSKSKHPGAMLNAILVKDIFEKGPRSRFIRFGNKFGLSQLNEKKIDGDKSESIKEITRTPVCNSQESVLGDETQGKILQIFQKEIQQVRLFLLNDSELDVSQERLYFWVWFCHQFGLYSEGDLVFRKIDPIKISPQLYQNIKKIGLICENRMQYS